MSHFVVELTTSGDCPVVERAADDRDTKRGSQYPDDRPSETLFRGLAMTAPRHLVQRIQAGGLSPGLLARGAEAVGLIGDSSLVVPCLIGLLEHSEPLVREGAIYGLARHMNPEVRLRLQQIADDPRTTPGVREAAREALEGDE